MIVIVLPNLYVPSVLLDAIVVIVGAVVSTVIVKSGEVVLLPKESVSVTEMVHSPLARVANVQLPEESVQETLVEPAFVAVRTAVPAKLPLTVNVGVLSAVVLSESDTPRSEAAARSGVAPIVLKSMVETRDVLVAASLTTTYALYAVPGLSPVRFAVLALASADDVPLVTASPWVTTVEAEGADSDAA